MPTKELAHGNAWASAQICRKEITDAKPETMNLYLHFSFWEPITKDKVQDICRSDDVYRQIHAPAHRLAATSPQRHLAKRPSNNLPHDAIGQYHLIAAPRLGAVKGLIGLLEQFVCRPLLDERHHCQANTHGHPAER